MKCFQTAACCNPLKPTFFYALASLDKYRSKAIYLRATIGTIR